MLEYSFRSRVCNQKGKGSGETFQSLLTLIKISFSNVRDNKDRNNRITTLILSYKQGIFLLVDAIRRMTGSCIHPNV